MEISDIKGQTFEYWKVIDRSFSKKKKGKSSPAFWLCECKCGKKKVVRGDILRSGQSKSCGCWDKPENGFKRALKEKTKLNEQTGCLEWLGMRDKDGYARYGLKNEIASRLIMKKIHGESIKDKVVCHSCDNPGCVNFEHLWLGTIKENNEDKINKKRHLYGSSHFKTHLTESDIEHIRILYKEGVFQSIIAAEYDISQSTVSTIVLNKFWKHI